MGDMIYTPKEAMSLDWEGASLMLYPDKTLIREGHPMLKGREQFFRPIEHKVMFEVEQATAAPGEKRGAAEDKAAAATEPEDEKHAEAPKATGTARHSKAKG